MNPLIQLKKATPLFVIALVLACFTLSPQAFAEQVEPLTFTDVHNQNCHRNELRIRTATPDPVTIKVWGPWGAAYMKIERNTGKIAYRDGGTGTISAQAYKSGWTASDVARCYNKRGSGNCH